MSWAVKRRPTFLDEMFWIRKFDAYTADEFVLARHLTALDPAVRACLAHTADGRTTEDLRVRMSHCLTVLISRLLKLLHSGFHAKLVADLHDFADNYRVVLGSRPLLQKKEVHLLFLECCPLLSGCLLCDLVVLNHDLVVLVWMAARIGVDAGLQFFADCAAFCACCTCFGLGTVLASCCGRTGGSVGLGGCSRALPGSFHCCSALGSCITFSSLLHSGGAFVDSSTLSDFLHCSSAFLGPRCGLLRRFLRRLLGRLLLRGLFRGLLLLCGLLLFGWSLSRRSRRLLSGGSGTPAPASLEMLQINAFDAFES